MTDIETHSYLVTDISCDHCVTAISAEVNSVDGVTSVAVDVATKRVTVQGGNESAVIAAIGDAGYEVAPNQISTDSGRSAATAEQQIDDGVIRVTKWTFPPGSETGHHRHDHDLVVVPITNGDLTIESAEGATVASLTIGESYNRAAGVEHNVANDGDETVAFVEVELLS